MIQYSYRVLDIDGAIASNKQKIARPDYANVIKLGLSQLNVALEDARKCQKRNIHRQIGWTECSCGLMVETAESDSFSVVTERLFRTFGHVDHSEGTLTKLMVRKWKAINTSGEFHCWWCIECGYLGEAVVRSGTKAPDAPPHECPSSRVKRELIAKLKKCLVKPGTKPVVAGVGSWNAAIQKAISLLAD